MPRSSQAGVFSSLPKGYAVQACEGWHHCPIAKGPAHVGRLIAQAEDYTRSLPHFVRPMFDALIEVLHSLDEKIALLDGEISRRAEEDEDARRLKTIRRFRALARHSGGDQRLGPSRAELHERTRLRRSARAHAVVTPPG